MSALIIRNSISEATSKLVSEDNLVSPPAIVLFLIEMLLNISSLARQRLLNWFIPKKYIELLWDKGVFARKKLSVLSLKLCLHSCMPFTLYRNVTNLFFMLETSLPGGGRSYNFSAVINRQVSLAKLITGLV